MPTLETRDGTTLFYRDWGTGRPVLFCSAWCLDSMEFQTQMTHLVAHGLRVIAYDRRGHGRSDDPGRGFDYDTLADDLADLITHLDLRELMLVGHSMGGAELVRYLTRHGSERVERIVLIAAVLPYLLVTPDNPVGVDGVLAERLRQSWLQDFGRWLDDNSGAYFGDGLPGCDVSQTLRDWTMVSMTTASLRAAIECNRAVVETDFRAELAEITLPTLIIHGDHDASIPLELGGRRQAEILPDNELIVYENAPHGLYLTHGERLSTDLLTFATAAVATAA